MRVTILAAFDVYLGLSKNTFNGPLEYGCFNPF